MPGRGVISTNARGLENPYMSRASETGRQGEVAWRRGFFNAYFSRHQAYRIIDIPPDVESFTADLELTRGLTKRGTLVDPDGKPVIGGTVLRRHDDLGIHQDADRRPVSKSSGWISGRPRLMIFAHKDRGLVGSVLIKDEDLKTDTSAGGSPRARRLDQGAVGRRGWPAHGRHPASGS